MSEEVSRLSGENGQQAVPEQRSGGARGYSDAFDIYWELGWRGVLPLKRGTKAPPPTGYTGGAAPDPTQDQMIDWALSSKYRDGGLCLRLPDGVIGIDVDAYDKKTGAATLAEAERRWGTLPPTIRSTSRADCVSGIRLYRVPPGTKLIGGIKFPELGIGDIDIIQHHHRFVNCSPTIHPEGRAYKWYDEQAGLEAAIPPPPEELTPLSATWLAGLSADAPRSGSTRDRRRGHEQAAVNAQPSYDVARAITAGRPSVKVAEGLAEGLHGLQQGVSRHDTMLGYVLVLLRYGQAGQPGVGLALGALRRAFVEFVGQDRPGGEAEAGREFDRMITNADRVLAESASTVEVEAAQAEEAFWAQRPVLLHIQRFAAVRRANPYATLGAVLRRVITLVPPSVQLPPIIGHNASVNLFTASVGKSGQGKDIANGVGAAAISFLNRDGTALDDPPSPGIGSGEGLARYFRGHGSSEESAQVAANVEVNEVGTMAALAERKGGTLVGELLKAFTGQALGFSNAQRATTTHIAAHTYRLCMGISAQPENAGFFLDREKDGLPQRFLWLPIVNPYARPPGGEPPEEILPAKVVVPAFPTLIPDTPFLVGVPESVRSEIEHFRYLVEIGSDEVNPLDSHLMLLRLKVALGLTVLDERRDINQEDWRIAGQLIEISNRVRAEMHQVVRDGKRRANTARAYASADRQTIIDNCLSEQRQQRVAGAIQRKLQRVGLATRRQLAKSCTLAIRGEFDPVFDELLDSGVIVRDGESEQYRLATV